ncbi:MAG: hypothetical protein SNJ59_03270 [Aggregatilineales bacterium]
MTYSSSDLHLQNLISALTDAILVDQTDLDMLYQQYNVPRAEVESLLQLIQRLHVALVGVQPSRRFVQRLRQDLIGQSQWNLVNRVRYLPPRVQIAAGIALIAGFMLLSRRRLAALAREDRQLEASTF